jgi:hypothetical protein
MQYLERSMETTGYRVRYQELPAFDLTGFTKIVESGGEVYKEVRADGRWEVLKTLNRSDQRFGYTARHGLAVGDFDSDGHLNLFAGTLEEESTVWVNQGHGAFHMSAFK